MFTLAYLKTLGERALTVFASTLGGLLTAGAFDLMSAPWERALSTAGMAALVAVLISVAGGKATSSNAPAMTSKQTEDVVAKPVENPVGL